MKFVIYMYIANFEEGGIRRPLRSVTALVDIGFASSMFLALLYFEVFGDVLRSV